MDSETCENLSARFKAAAQNNAASTSIRPDHGIATCFNFPLVILVDPTETITHMRQRQGQSDRNSESSHVTLTQYPLNQILKRANR